MFFRIVEQMAEREGVTKQLKANNQMKWVARTNNIRSRATEVIKPIFDLHLNIRKVGKI